MPTTDHKNLKIDASDKNFTFDGIYFYYYNNTTNSIVQKTDDGNVAFTFPVAAVMTQEVKSIHYEGLDRQNSINGACFWTLEGQAGNTGIVIRRLVVDNYICKSSGVNTAVVAVTPLTITKTNNNSINWSSIESMAIECYETKLLDKDSFMPQTGGSANNANNSGNTYIRMYDDLTDNLHGTKQFKGENGYADSAPLKTDPDIGMSKSQQTLLQQFKYDDDTEIIDTSVKIIIGPDDDGYFETATVSDVPQHYVATYAGNPLRYVDVKIATPLSRSYPEGTPVRFYKNIFLFSSYNNGTLYLLNDLGGIVKSVEGVEYGSVSSAVFSQRDRKVIFTKQSNASFLEPNQEDLRIVKTMTLDNISVDSITVIPIYDACVSYSGSLFRLQTQQVFNGALENFTTCNYVVTPLFPLVKSISLRPVPQIIAADNIDTTTITITVRDQFNQPVSGVFVNLTENDATGGVSGQGGFFIYYPEGGGGPLTYNGTITDVLQTDVNGQASIIYQAGNNNTDVTIAASVKQIVS